jgi:hypothetical protein
MDTQIFLSVRINIRKSLMYIGVHIKSPHVPPAAGGWVQTLAAAVEDGRTGRNTPHLVGVREQRRRQCYEQFNQPRRSTHTEASRPPDQGKEMRGARSSKRKPLVRRTRPCASTDGRDQQPTRPVCHTRATKSRAPPPVCFAALLLHQTNKPHSPTDKAILEG